MSNKYIFRRDKTGIYTLRRLENGEKVDTGIIISRSEDNLFRAKDKRGRDLIRPSTNIPTAKNRLLKHMREVDAEALVAKRVG